MTNDGELANGLTHPRHGVEKIYHVQVAGHVEEDTLRQLRKGMHLAEGFAHAKYVRVKSHRHRGTVLEMVLDEGRNREIRRLLARLGHKVQRLTRVAVGPVRLGDMPAGSFRELSPKEVAALHQAVARGRRSKPSSSHRTEDKKHSNRVGRRHRDTNRKRSVIGGPS
jgi:23S rRNA pseudouridine2605 synthase